MALPGGAEASVELSTIGTENISEAVGAIPVKQKKRRSRRTWLTRKICRENVGPVSAVASTSEVGTQTEPLNTNTTAAEVSKEDVHTADSDSKSCEVAGKLISISEPLPTLIYEEVAKVSRTMHYTAFEQCAEAGRFIPSRVRYSHKTFLPRDKDFVWFRAQSDEVTDETHDWFGNVRCSFDLLTFLGTNPNVNLFYVDCAYFGYSSASRILLSTEAHVADTKKIDLGNLKYGDPLMFDGEKLMFLSRDVGRTRQWVGKHQTQFVIDADTIDLQNLFEICDKTAVNHSKANRKDKNSSFIPHQCLAFNSRNRTCPSASTLEETHERLNGNTT